MFYCSVICHNIYRNCLSVSNRNATRLVFRKIALGLYHSMAVTEEGELFLWGWNVKGQLCQPPYFKQSSYPISISLESLERSIVDVAGGEHHTLIVAQQFDSVGHSVKFLPASGPSSGGTYLRVEGVGFTRLNGTLLCNTSGLFTEATIITPTIIW